MNITELISRLEKLKEEHGDWPVLISDHSEDYHFPFMEIESVYAVKDENLVNEDNDDVEILSYIALDYM